MKNRTGTIDDAFKFMKTKHGIQERKTGGYYFEHPRRVASLVIRFKDSYRIEDLLIAALLHDTLEDTTATYEQIEDKFGTMIASIVLELTSDKTKTLTNQNKKEYLADKMINMSSYALVIKLCDRLDNIADLDQTDEIFRKRYIEETIYLMDEIDKKRDVITITQHRLIHEIREQLKNYK
jgi:(p)ppGpp synthase/HD superfamily hydrolase